jgi:hypothetical protein
MLRAWEWIKKFVRDQMTERDGTSYCAGRSIGVVSAAVACYKFAVLPTPDYVSFGTCIGAIIAAIAAKNWTERENA